MMIDFAYMEVVIFIQIFVIWVRGLRPNNTSRLLLSYVFELASEWIHVATLKAPPEYDTTE